MSLKLLCVDEVEEILNALKASLERYGLEVHVAASAEAGLAWLSANQPFAVISDHNLAGGEGVGFLRKARREHCHVQNILLTDYSAMDAAREGLNDGTVDFVLIKPWRDSRLETVIKAACRRYLDASGIADVEMARLGDLEDTNDVTGELVALDVRQTQLIERAKQEWEQTLDAISDPVTMLDSELKIRRANKAAADYSGRSVRHLPGEHCYEALFGRQSPCPTCPLALTSGRIDPSSPAVVDLEDRAKDRVFRLSVFRHTSASGAATFTCYYRNVTEEKRLARQVLQSEKMAGVGQLAGGVAHEINNPIGVIISFAQLCRSAIQMGDLEELEDNVGEIEAAALRCKNIVRSLLDFSRPSADGEWRLVNLADVLEKAWFLVATDKAAKEVELVKEFAPELPSVVANENQMMQVFVNLIQNAVHAMPRGGKLTLSTSFDSSTVTGTVRDEGEGVKPEHVHKIFDPFFTTKEPGKGTGLGLSVSFGIVERHGGKIEVDSRAGQGSRFLVSLPLEAPNWDGDAPGKQDDL